MDSTKKIETTTFIAAVLMIMLWTYAAVSKFADYHRFVDQIKLAPVPLMQLLGPTLGWLVPLTEVILIPLLWVKRSRVIGLYLSFLLLLIFEIYIAAMLLSGLELPCTCGGLISKLQWNEHLIFNGFFMATSLSPVIHKCIIRIINHKNIRHNSVGVDI